jgi:hypothetical protein
VGALLELVSLITVAFVVGSTRQRDSGGIVPKHHPSSNTKNNMAAICGKGESMPVPSFLLVVATQDCKQEPDRAVIDQQARLFFVK